MTETPAATALHIEYLSRSVLESQSPAWWQQTLGVAACETPLDLDVPSAASFTPPLGGGESLFEVFRAVGEGVGLSATARHGRIRYRACDDLLFGMLQLPAVGEVDALMTATESAYQEIFALLDRVPQRHLIRIWNYLPDINLSQDGEERYRRFNAARQAAFRASGRANMGTVPAACALGSPAGSPLSVYFLAGRSPARMIENPRQTSAYHYPPKFGRHSPLFSRACLWGEGDERLFISGTASIVGHETLHRGDVAAQTRETLENLEALIGEANRLSGGNRFTLRGLVPKVYVRHAQHLPVIRAVLGEALDPARGIYLSADVCREDLLVEIEAIG